MITFMPESRDNLLVAKANQKLTTEDYEKSFIPKLEELLEKYSKVNILFLLDEDFTGWKIGAAWDDAKFGMKHRKDFEKIAVVGGPKWVEWSTKIGAHLVKGEVKTYKLDELDIALDWIK